ncbi:MAG: TIGR01459 family HAD-type hydrolase [Sphingorhabdus sp.]|nr:TIGR01459 family HAD-type hydrolase [Sphingorhabdus sp.]
MTGNLTFFDNLDPRYRVIFCDVWGCLHNGVESFPAAVQRLQHWRDEGRTVILLTNAPRPAPPVAMQLAALGVRDSCYNAIVTSGGAGLAAAVNEFPDQNFHFIGSARDREVITAAGYSLDGDSASKVTICTGFHEGHEDDTAFHDPEFQQMVTNGSIFLCLNPDKMIMRGATPELCAGALAARYEAFGGTVRYFGKPHNPIYAYSHSEASKIIGAPLSKSAILAIGDGVHTDLRGAYNYGLDFAFITGGIEAPKIAEIGIDAFLDEIIAVNRMPGYRPQIIAPSLA